MTYQALLTSPVIEALGRSLLHFLWQGTVLGLALWSVQLMLPGSLSRQRSARIRYIAACFAMLLMVLSLAATVVHYYPSHTDVTRTVLRSPAQAVRSSAGDSLLPAPVPAAAGEVGLDGWIVCFWLAGVLTLSVRFAGGWVRAQLMKRRGRQAVSPELGEMFERLRQQLHVSMHVRLFVSSVARVPMVIGWIRPYILLPVTAITGLTDIQLRLVLAHELSHIRRYDYLINLLQTAVETALFYHPAVWWVSHQLRVERENCCDDHAIDLCGDPAAYAGALAQLEEFRLQTPEAAVAATGGALLRRVHRVLEPASGTHTRSQSLAAAMVAIFVMGIVAVPAMSTLGKAQQAFLTKPEAQTPPTPNAQTIQQPESPATPKQEADKIVQREIEEGQAGAAAEALEDQYKLQFDKYNQMVDRFQRSADFSKWLGQDVLQAAQNGPSAQSTDLLLQLYDTSQESEVKEQILDHLGNSKSPKAFEKLLSVARSGASLELRLRAIDAIGFHPDAFDALVSLYDDKPDLETRRHLVDAFGMSKDPRALNKLFSIAQSDPALVIRREAVDCIAMR